VIVRMLFGFVLAAGFSLLLTPWVIKLARFVGAIDQPGERKAHSHPMPRLGGVAVFLSCFISFGLVALLDRPLLSGSWIFSSEGGLFGLCLFIVMLLGFWDDLRSLKPFQKFGVQVLLSSVVYIAGFRVSAVMNPFGGGWLDVHAVDYPLTVLWIVGVTNALNLIDGLDGLAAGVATIAAFTILPIALLWGDTGTAVLAVILAGALIGFLRYNFNPAKIFLGDSGSLFIGFMLAVLSIKSSTKSTTTFALVIPILALGLPIMDTLLSMIRRFLHSFLPSEAKDSSIVGRLKTIFSPDKSHIHHRLLARGLSHRTAVLVLYGVSSVLGIGAFAVTIAGDTGTSLVLAVVGIATVIGVRQLRYKEMALLRSGILLPIYDWELVKSDSFRVFLDVGFMIGSYIAAWYITDWHHAVRPVNRELIITVSVASGIQFAVFWISGFYRGTMRHFSIGDVAGIGKTVTLAVLAAGITQAIFPVSERESLLLTMVLDYFFLLFLVIVSRYSFQLLDHFWVRETRGGRRVLLYGANADGVIVLNKILSGELPNLVPVGFLDEDPRMEGKTLNRFPIFGGHWKLPYVMRTMSIDQIILVDHRLPAEALRRVVRNAEENSTPLRVFRMRLEEFPIEVRAESPIAPVSKTAGASAPALPGFLPAVESGPEHAP
jgi:UDP-GlcNAc:undecaprenyl-phosphate/decaprenyl-phosphate GlcNAc-1-phosphate transferase